MLWICDSCRKVYPKREEFEPTAAHLEQRVTPGYVVPAGECRKCGAPVYPRLQLYLAGDMNRMDVEEYSLVQAEDDEQARGWYERQKPELDPEDIGVIEIKMERAWDEAEVL